MSNCIFCKIAAGEIPSNVICETDEVFAFHDINPQAPLHAVVIPKRHIADIAASGDGDVLLLGKLMRATADVASHLGISESGFRIVVNNGPDGGQTVDHLHIHVLGGRHLTWPPG
jgi:histidine triad (HIT) family protein